MKILSSFTHPQVVPNLNEFLSSAEHKGIYFEECSNILQNVFLCVSMSTFPKSENNQKSLKL